MSPYLQLLYRALESGGIGLKVETPEPLKLQQRLYAARKQEANPALNKLSIAPDPSSATQLWIINNDKKQKASDVSDAPTV